MSSKPIDNAFGARSTLSTAGGDLQFHRLSVLTERGLGDVDRLPFCIRVLLEGVLRNVDGLAITEADVERLCRWDAKNVARQEMPFMPDR